MDKNGNGQIEPDEVDGRTRFMIQRAAQNAGLDPSKPLPIKTLVESAQRQFGGGNRGGFGGDRGRSDRGDDDRNRRDRDRRDRDRGNRRGRDSGSSNQPKPAIAAFGEAPTVAAVPGFDVPLSVGAPAMDLDERYEDYVLRYVDDRVIRQYDKNKNGILDPDEIATVRWRDDWKTDDKNSDGRLTREELAERMARTWGRGRKSPPPGAATASRGNGSWASPAGAADRARQHAAALIKQNDKNNNGKLDGDELKSLSSFSRGADFNRDGTITLDEMTRRVGSFGGGPVAVSLDSSRSSNRSRRPGLLVRMAEAQSNADRWSGRESYRFLTPTERLPKGLPSWFVQKDVDGDGQVTMAEFSSTWNETDLVNYTKFDKNGDGRITPSELVEEKK
jgi:Ca2+-binding EF-hand superfamily protein